ncbi:hypothetical protein HYS93_02065 [Candidatus Daviesbacteria bacterium]|nr:hypothetical protein [Candidatus Daviesbacteria bacterium]
MAVILLASLAYISIISFILNQDFSGLDIRKYIPVTKEPLSFNLEINSPDDELVVFDNTILVSGQTAPKALVIISTDKEDISLQVSKKGEFSKVIDLNPGLNKILISSIDSSGKSKSESKTIYYSEEKL